MRLGEKPRDRVARAENAVGLRQPVDDFAMSLPSISLTIASFRCARNEPCWRRRRTPRSELFTVVFVGILVVVLFFAASDFIGEVVFG